MLSYLKAHNSNLYSAVVSLLLVIWFNGASGLLNHYIPERGLMTSLILLLIPAVLFFMDDGNLDKLYKPYNIEYPILSSTRNSRLYRRR